MKFDEEIDDSIVMALSKNPTLHYMGLLRLIQKSYRHISVDAFNSHIKKMLSEGYIIKDDKGKRGKRVYYSLTEKTKQMQRLKLFKSKREIAVLNNQIKEERRLIVYLLIFFLSYHTAYTFKSKEQLKSFLSEAHVSMNDLRLHRKRHFDGKQTTRTTWATGSRIYVTKVEEMASNKNVFYTCSLPGQSPREILLESERVFAHANITLTEMEDALSIAQSEGILKIVMCFRNELRYEITDQSLVNFIGYCWDLYQLILEKLQIVWRTIRGPNDQEMKWLELIRGCNEADTLRTQAYQQRHSLRKAEKRNRITLAKKEIEDLEKEIQESITDLTMFHATTINKYQFPTERVLEMVAPKSLQKSDLRRSRRLV